MLPPTLPEPCTPTANVSSALPTLRQVDGKKEVRTEAVQLVPVDERLSCVRFRDEEWLAEERPTWPKELTKNVLRYAEEVPQEKVVMPKKGSMPSKGELDFG